MSDCPLQPKADIPLTMPASVESFHALYLFTRWVQAVTRQEWHVDHAKQTLGEIGKKADELLSKTPPLKEGG